MKGSFAGLRVVDGNSSKISEELRGTPAKFLRS
jgi:hypothetical protein